MSIALTTAIISVFLAYFLYKPIHKYNYFIYGFFALIALAFHEDGNAITLGFIPFGLFLVVIFTGALSKGVIRKRLAMVRAEYAIIATILLLPHAFGYIEIYLDEIFPELASVSQILGVIAFVIIIPLFVTSFQFVRKKMNYKSWKLLHRAAYIVYGLIWFHLLLLQNERFYLYLAVGILYILTRVYDIITTQKKRA
jgi:DMSO/TMAO reductase YedYZ heme-binding membrane subunit